jgi:hypothetical protein
MIKAGNKLYEVCVDCGQMICVNKRFLGSLHLCTTEEERADPAIRNQIDAQYAANKRAMSATKHAQPY